MDCPPGQKNVAVVERWPLVEVRLYIQRFIQFSPSVFKDCRIKIIT